MNTDAIIMRQNDNPMNEFDEKALEWDTNRMHLDRTIAVAAKLREQVSFKPGMKAMEFGAGTGLLSFHLKDQFAEITLMDSSDEMLKKAEQKMDESDRSKFRTRFLDIEKEDYTGELFDIIYSQMVLHHIQNTEAILAKFHRMLNPGGILAIADLYKEDGSFHEGNPDVHFGFDPADLTKVISHFGFRNNKIVTCFVIRKEEGAEKIKEYPVFLLTASKQE